MHTRPPAHWHLMDRSGLQRQNLNAALVWNACTFYLYMASHAYKQTNNKRQSPHSFIPSSQNRELKLRPSNILSHIPSPQEDSRQQHCYPQTDILSIILNSLLLWLQLISKTISWCQGSHANPWGPRSSGCSPAPHPYPLPGAWGVFSYMGAFLFFVACSSVDTHNCSMVTVSCASQGFIYWNSIPIMRH